MTRILQFVDEKRNQARFVILYGGMLAGGINPERRGGIEVFRREARILEALDAVSEVIDEKQPRAVRAGSMLRLEQADFALLEHHVSTTAWRPVDTREVVDTIDWLSAADKEGE